MYNESHGNRTVALTVAVEYKTWKNMKYRCYSPSAGNYCYYGAQGVTVCDRWLESFENFLADMGRKPTPQHSIDRYPNKNGNYEPGNCRWATRKEQNNNLRPQTKTELPLAA